MAMFVDFPTFVFENCPSTQHQRSGSQSPALLLWPGPPLHGTAIGWFRCRRAFRSCNLPDLAQLLEVVSDRQEWENLRVHIEWCGGLEFHHVKWDLLYFGLKNLSTQLGAVTWQLLEQMQLLSTHYELGKFALAEFCSVPRLLDDPPPQFELRNVFS